MRQNRNPSVPRPLPNGVRSDNPHLPDNISVLNRFNYPVIDPDFGLSMGQHEHQMPASFDKQRLPALI